jgi:hypothetical protein
MIELFDYAGKDPIGEVRAWRDRLQVAQQAQLDQKLDVLARADNEMLPGLIAGPLRVKGVKYPHIYKLQIGGKVRLRPFLCRAPSMRTKRSRFWLEPPSGMADSILPERQTRL